MPAGDPEAIQELRDAYLDLVKRSVAGVAHGDGYRFVKRPRDELAGAIYDGLAGQGVELVTRGGSSHPLYEEGGGWPLTATTMIGLERLENLLDCTRTVLEERVPGDLIETGVWRGGATILMRAALKAYGISDRTVWVADSFEGVPRPDPDRWPADAGDRLHEQPALAVSLEDVRANFERYGLLDEQVRFLPGRFRDTLPGMRAERWSLIRLDGDLYESTIDSLENLYPRLSPGGFVIVDDYGAMRPCKEAVRDFREAHRVSEELEEIDWTGVYWRKSADA